MRWKEDMTKKLRVDESKTRHIVAIILGITGIIYFIAMLSFTEAKDMHFDNEELDQILNFHAKSSTVDEDVVCPTLLETPLGEKVTYTTVIEKDYTNSNVIMFRSSFQYVKAYVNDKQVLDYGYEQSTFNNVVPSSAWQIIRLDNPLEIGDEICIELTCDSDPFQGLFRGIYVGTKASMFYHILSNASMSLLVAVPLFILGILYIVISGVFPEKISKRKLRLIGILSSMMSIWILLESQLIQLVWGNLPASYTGLFIIFSFLPLLICELLFNFKMFEESLLMRIAYVISVICMILFHAFQIFGVSQYNETPIIIHTAFFAIIVALIFEAIRRINGKKYKDDRDIIIAGSVFALFGLCDIINIYIFNEIMKDVVFTQVGIFAFMLLLGYYTLRRAITDHETTMEQEFWKQVAHTDALTKLGNRLYFEERKKEIRKAKYTEDLQVLIIDINDLKLINDEFGHEMGDVAIATVGQVILEAFDDCGDGFRIGGDEFCIFVEDLSRDFILKKLEACEEALDEFTEEYEVSLHISYGIAEIASDGVDTAISIADAAMYRNKEYGKMLRKKLQVNK